MNSKLIVGIIALVVVAGGIYAFSMQNKTSDSALTGEEMNKADEMVKEEGSEVMADKNVEMADEVMKKDDMMKKEEMMDEGETDMMDKDAAMSDTMMKGSYEAYSADKVMKAETGDVVLFFHASWCPSCRSLNASIEGSMAEIPDGVTILKADYDKETELKKKYGVTTQHTLVQVDKDGNLIKKWSGSPTLAKLVTEIQ